VDVGGGGGDDHSLRNLRAYLRSACSVSETETKWPASPNATLHIFIWSSMGSLERSRRKRAPLLSDGSVFASARYPSERNTASPK